MDFLFDYLALKFALSGALSFILATACRAVFKDENEPDIIRAEHRTRLNLFGIIALICFLAAIWTI